MKKSDYILVIEDDVDQQALLKLQISKMGYKSRCSSTAAEGLEILRTELPSMIILDLMLPDTPGLVLLRQIKEEPKWSNIPIIIATSLADDEVIVAAFANGASDIVVKPYKFSQLLPRIHKAFEIADYQEKLRIANKKLEEEKQGLRRYFPPDVVEKILDGEIEPELGGKFTQATIMFADLRGSTSLAEELKAKDLVDLLNSIFGDIFDIVFGQGGSVNKLLGDGVLATFGVPLSLPEAEEVAVRVALQIQEHIRLFNQSRPQYLDHDLSIGIGIASGEIFVGNIGSSRLIEYTVIGDTVNLAARLQDLTKKYDKQILIDGATQEKVADKFLTSSLGRVRVRGRDELTSIYSLDA